MSMEVAVVVRTCCEKQPHSLEVLLSPKEGHSHHSSIKGGGMLPAHPWVLSLPWAIGAYWS